MKKEKFVYFLSIGLLFCLWIIYVYNFLNFSLLWIHETLNHFLHNSWNIIFNIFMLVMIFFLLILYYYRKNINIEKIYVHEKNNIFIIGLIFLSFLSIRFWLPFVYTWSYIDEYNHLLSAIDFNNMWHFSIFDKDGEYFRWAFLSFYLSIFFSIFWYSLIIAKLAISILSLISFLLVYKICNILFQEKKYTYLVLILFTFNPFLIFEHFYIRPYIFYEISLLVIIYWFLKIEDYIKKQYIIKTIFTILIINTIWFIIYFYSEKDVHRYIIVLISTLLTIYLFLFEFKKLNFKYNIFKINLHKKLFILIFTIPIMGYILNINDLIIAIFENRTYHGSITTSKYYDLFFWNYILLTLGSILTSYFLILNILKNKISNYQVVIYLIGCLLLFAHLVSNKNSHLFRWIIYLLPLYFIIWIYWFSIIYNWIQKEYRYLIIFIILFWNLNYPINFLKSPYIPTEINYMEYKNVADFVNKICQSKKTLWLMHNIYIFDFYNIKIDYTTNLHVEEKWQKEKYYLDDENKYRTIFKDIPIIFSRKELQDFIQQENLCIIITEESKHYWYYFNEQDLPLFDNFNKIQFWTQTPINVFYN